jgi:hypothetical protein
MTGEVNVVTKIRGRAAPSNGARRPLPKATAKRAGRMFEALLALDLDDTEAIALFWLEEGFAPASMELEQLRPLLAGAAHLAELLRQDVMLSGDPTRIEGALREVKGGTDDARARVVAGVECFAKCYATRNGPGPDDFQELISGLAACAPEFRRLTPAIVHRLFTRTTPRAKRLLSSLKCAAELSLEVGAFDAEKRSDETPAASLRRVVNAFDQALKRRAKGAERLRSTA